MDESNKRALNICVIGSSKLTEELIKYLSLVNNKPKIVFGLKKRNLLKKSYFYNQEQLSRSFKYKLVKNESWDTLLKYLKIYKINLIISFGNSKIIPKKILNHCKIIGNHGAELPYIKGGASLSWGRMMNLGYWYTSIFELDNKIDNGNILSTKKFYYNKNETMKEFYDLSIFNTIEQFKNLFEKNFITENKNLINKKKSININYLTDTFDIIKISKKNYLEKKIIYLKSRKPEDSIINKSWPISFIKIFKIANNYPFPKYFYKN